MIAHHIKTLLQRKSYAIVTINGTTELGDVWQDLKMNQVDFEETGAQVHSGFYECFLALKPKVENFLDRTLKVADSEKQVDEILFVGHSLGGAIASLMGMSLAPKYEKETLNFRVVSVGAPKIGNQALQNLFKQRFFDFRKLSLSFFLESKHTFVFDLTAISSSILHRCCIGLGRDERKSPLR